MRQKSFHTDSEYIKKDEINKVSLSISQKCIDIITSQYSVYNVKYTLTWDLVKKRAGILAKRVVEGPPKPRSINNSVGSTDLDISTLSTLKLNVIF